MRQVAVAVTSRDREALAFESFAAVREDPRVAEIIVVDGSDEETFARMAEQLPARVSLYSNREERGPYLSKLTAVENCFTDWVVLLDSDNRIGPGYLDALYAAPEWQSDTIYAPVLAAPSLDYSEFSGKVFGRENVHVAGAFWPLLFVALNTGNYLVPQVPFYEAVARGDEPEMFAADCLYSAWLWLSSGGRFCFVPGLGYEHKVHEGHWAQNRAEIEPLTAELQRRILESRWHA